MANLSPDNNTKFINPYNFVRHNNDNIVKNRNEYNQSEKQTFTGYMNCNLSIKTPLAIPDSENIKEENKHKTYPFFSVNNIPIIPGSEIRGLIRNIYEIITDSCFSVVTSNEISSRNINGDTDPTPGILYYKDGKWILTPAKKESAYTETKRRKLEEKYNENTEAVSREWALSVQLATNMAVIKKAVDNSIKSANSYKDFLDKLKELQIEIIEINEKECFIQSKKLYDKEDKIVSLIKQKLASVNAEKKWGDQYSKENLEKFFVKKNSERVKEFKRLYSEKIINFTYFTPISGPEIDITKEDVNKLNSILDYSIKYAEDNDELIKQINSVRPREDKKVPVFYHERNGKIVLTPSHFSREIYEHTVNDILDTVKKCDSKSNLCPACKLFGIITDTKNESVSSRIRFSDALVKEGYKLNKSATTLKVLSSPKTTAWEFYATGNYDDEGVMLKGRKLYFHNPSAENDINIYTFNKKTKSNSSVQLMTSGDFNFQVYFDKATEDEIKNIILALTLGDNNANSVYLHKLGHGKPLGLGSVKITVDDIVTRSVSKNTYEIENDTFKEYLNSLSNENPLFKMDNIDNIAISDLMKMSNYNFCNGKIISYPVIEPKPGSKLKENDLASHKYFGWIRGTLSFSNSNNQSCVKGLPTLDSCPAMPIIVTDGKNYTLKSDNTKSKKESSSDNRKDQSNMEVRTCTVCKKQFETPYKGTNPECNKCRKSNH